MVITFALLVSFFYFLFEAYWILAILSFMLMLILNILHYALTVERQFMVLMQGLSPERAKKILEIVHEQIQDNKIKFGNTRVKAASFKVV